MHHHISPSISHSHRKSAVTKQDIVIDLLHDHRITCALSCGQAHYTTAECCITAVASYYANWLVSYSVSLFDLLPLHIGAKPYSLLHGGCLFKSRCMARHGTAC